MGIVGRLLWGLVFGAVVTAPFLSMGSALAQRPGFVVKATEIKVEGSQRIEPETVRSYVSIRKGDPITPKGMDDALKNCLQQGCSRMLSFASREPQLSFASSKTRLLIE